MSEAWISVLGSVVVGLLTLLGVLASNSRAQAVTETKLEDLTREVREHNNFARRMPAMPSAPPSTPQISGIHLLPRGLSLTASPASQAMMLIEATPAIPIYSISFSSFQATPHNPPSASPGKFAL